MVPKKNGQLRICVDYGKLNAQTVDDPFSLPFLDSFLDMLAGYELYNFLDGFSGYNQVRLAPEDHDKIAFFMDLGVYIAVVIVFGVKMAPTTIQRAIVEFFEEFIPRFMQVFLDDFVIVSSTNRYYECLHQCLQCYHDTNFKLNPAKCSFAVSAAICSDIS